ncbi:hypothetical protein [Schleiferilactobacillus harbinensis]|uniref:hypothetical protein n=1 Tax=Schleiferilactobacillus harbinensis TaxID=304207 RepID=UPI0039EA6A8B
MDKKEILEMINDPGSIMRAENQQMKDRIRQKKLSDEDRVSLITEGTGSLIKTGAKALLNGNLGDLIFDTVEFGDKMSERLTEVKKSLVIADYVQQSDNHQKALERLTDLLTDPYGLTLYSKIISILNDSPADGDMMKVLANVLGNLSVENDFRKVFSDTKSLLSIIDKLSPQSLFLLKQIPGFQRIRIMNIGETSILGDEAIKSDLPGYIANAYSKYLHQQGTSVSEDAIYVAIWELHSFSLSKTWNFGKASGEKTNLIGESLTEIGKKLLKLIS